MDYEEMLKKGREELPKAVFAAERFEIPKAKGHIEGNKTVISNFQQIANDLGRNVNMMVKFILRELATPGVLKHSGLVIGSKTPASRINQKIEQFARKFVICEDCGKPETIILKEGNGNFIKCNACGAKHIIRKMV
jgi:translation initiation factor 2 subunit 2